MVKLGFHLISTLFLLIMVVFRRSQAIRLTLDPMAELASSTAGNVTEQVYSEVVPILVGFGRMPNLMKVRKIVEEAQAVLRIFEAISVSRIVGEFLGLTDKELHLLPSCLTSALIERDVLP